mgnify:FL=1
MDKKKISEGPIIPWAITLVLCLAIATLIRLVALAQGVDSGTANLVFVIVMGCCVVLYLIIWAILGESLIPWMMKRFQNRQIASPEQTPRVSTDTSPAESALPSIAEIKTEAEQKLLARRTEKLNLFNTYTLLIIVGTVKYIPFASRSSLNSMLQLSGEIEEAAIIQDIPWIKRMTRIIIPIQKSSIISGFLLPFMTCLRELSLFMLLCVQGFILSTTLDYFDEMGLYAFSSGINLILIVTILVCNTLVNKITGASLDKGIGG